MELAVCLPVILLLFLGSLECCDMIHLKHTLAVSSYEGIRKAIQHNSTNEASLARCNEILTARNVVNPSVTLNPPDVSLIPQGTPISITVSAACASHSILPLNFFGDRTINVTSTMVKE